MKQPQIPGTGCTKCQQMTNNTKAAADALGMEFELEKIKSPIK